VSSSLSVNPGQFYFHDGSFTDKGLLEPPAPAGHQVARGAEYQFGVDYSRLTADPSRAKGAGGYVYPPGTLPAASWR
jgi:hypothetical protein